ncbi:MAG: AAA family ATPase, partial [Bacteroidales bacterium]|nr:AAA family ATPase [Bacteroidales bacterium]
TKSTILKAIEWLLWPTWNLSVGDTDFYECDEKNTIEITGNIVGIPDDLKDEEKFGHYLRRVDIPIDKDDEDSVNDEPQDGQDIGLAIYLKIDDKLAPEWSVIRNGMAPKVISYKDRRLFCVGNVGEDYSKDFSWGRYSVLQKYDNDTKDIMNSAYTDLFRKAFKEFKVEGLDTVRNVVPEVGMKYGVSVSSNIDSRIQLQGNGFSTAMVSLYDGNAPLNQRGTGSQRLLSIGLNITASKKDALLLIDEIETGLEPYRICTLINVLRNNGGDFGQVIMTTHSAVAVAECNISELMVVHQDKNEEGLIQTPTLESQSADAQNSRKEDEAVRKGVRANPEAFLCKKIIMCEGKTEEGFIRALDTFLSNPEGPYNFRLAYKGVGYANGGGEGSIFPYADTLIKCGYEVCLLMDSDAPDDSPKAKITIDKKKQALRESGVKVFDWEDGNAIEEQIFNDVPIDVAEQLVNAAVEDRSQDYVKNMLEKFNSGLKEEEDRIPYSIEGGMIKLPDMSNSVKKQLGTVAKGKLNDDTDKKDDDEKKNKKTWYKRIDLGENIGNIVFQNINRLDPGSKLVQVIRDLISWVEDDDRGRGKKDSADE